MLLEAQGCVYYFSISRTVSILEFLLRHCSKGRQECAAWTSGRLVLPLQAPNHFLLNVLVTRPFHELRLYSHVYTLLTASSSQVQLLQYREELPWQAAFKISPKIFSSFLLMWTTSVHWKSVHTFQLFLFLYKILNLFQRHILHNVCWHSYV